MTMPADQAGHRRLPDFFIAGHSKSGTTALYEILREHPQIYMSRLKEPVFMASDLHEGLWATVATRPRTLDAYLELFAPARPEQRAGEASSVYLWSRTAAANIAELQPAARIIAILREPASFLRSLHLQLLQNRIETVNAFAKAISLEPARREGKHIPRNCPFPQALLYSDRVQYIEQLDRYQTLFGRENVLVLIYDDFRRDNRATVRTILDFLEVNDDVTIDPPEANPTVRVRSRQLDDLLRVKPVVGGPVTRGVKAGVKAFTSRQVRHGALRLARRRLLYTNPPPPDDGVMLELRRRFKGEVVMLGELLDRDLVSLWGYDSLD
jgi:Sulfotransferase domain